MSDIRGRLKSIMPEVYVPMCKLKVDDNAFWDSQLRNRPTFLGGNHDFGPSLLGDTIRRDPWHPFSDPPRSSPEFSKMLFSAADPHFAAETLYIMDPIETDLDPSWKHWTFDYPPKIPLVFQCQTHICSKTTRRYLYWWRTNRGTSLIKFESFSSYSQNEYISLEKIRWPELKAGLSFNLFRISEVKCFNQNGCFCFSPNGTYHVREKTWWNGLTFFFVKQIKTKLVLYLDYVHPEDWGRFSFWLIFFKWVETTNQGQ